MKKNKRYTPGLADIEMAQGVLEKKRKKKKRDEWLASQRAKSKGKEEAQ